MGMGNRTHTIPSFLSSFILNIFKSELFKPHLCSKPAKSTRKIYRKKNIMYFILLIQKMKNVGFMILHSGSIWNYYVWYHRNKIHKSKVK